MHIWPAIVPSFFKDIQFIICCRPVFRTVKPVVGINQPLCVAVPPAPHRAARYRVVIRYGTVKIDVSTSNSQASGTGAKTDKIIEIYDPTYSSIAQRLKKSNEHIAVYPNPAKDEINIYNNIPRSKGQYKYSIFNVSGQVLSTGSLQSGTNTVGISGLSTGAYLLKVFNGLEQVSSTQFRKL